MKIRLKAARQGSLQRLASRAHPRGVFHCHAVVVRGGSLAAKHTASSHCEVCRRQQLEKELLPGENNCEFL